MLESLIGPDAFFAGIRAYIAKFEYRNATSGPRVACGFTLLYCEQPIFGNVSRNRAKIEMCVGLRGWWEADVLVCRLQR